MEHLPVFLTTKGQKSLVVGGGENALRKTRLLVKTDFTIQILAPCLCAGLARLVQTGQVKWRQKRFEPNDLDKIDIIFATTGQKNLDAEISHAARQRGVLINVVDRPDLSDFIMPSLVDRSPVVVAIGTSGTAPVLARHIRSRIEALLPKNIGALARFADKFRGAAKAMIAGFDNRRRFWEGFFNGPVARQFLSGDVQGATDSMLGYLNHTRDSLQPVGRIDYLETPNATPDLLSLRALNALQEADLIVYDQRTEASFLDYVRRDAEQLFVGKRNGKAVVPPAVVNRLLANAAQRGRKVIRLTGPATAADLAEKRYLRDRKAEVDLLPVASTNSSNSSPRPMPAIRRAVAGA